MINDTVSTLDKNEPKTLLPNNETLVNQEQPPEPSSEKVSEKVTENVTENMTEKTNKNYINLVIEGKEEDIDIIEHSHQVHGSGVFYLKNEYSNFHIICEFCKKIFDLK